MSLGLHVVCISSGKDKNFDASFGNLVLQEAGTFAVTIKEYVEEIKKIDDEIKQQLQKNDEEYNKYLKIFNEKAKEGWTPKEIESNEANARIREQTVKKIKENIAALEQKKKIILSKFKDISWCWQIVGNGLEKQSLKHNETFSYGISHDYDVINFPKLLEGGGLAWLEVFRDNDPATGKVPNGLYVQAIGKPNVLRTEWTDHECVPIPGPVKFGSEVLLNIYTEGMYGQEIEIELIDEDYWFFDPNDKLNVSKTGTFMAEVNIFPIHNSEFKKEGVDGLLTKSNTNENDPVKREQFIQKAVIKVSVNPAWKSDGGSNLKIFPTARLVKTSTVFKDFERTYLEVSEEGVLYDDPAAAYPDNPTFIGDIETNVGAFHPCKYEKIEFKPVPETETEKARTIFDKEHQEVLAITVPIICPDTDHMQEYALSLISLETKECRFVNTDRSHSGKSLIVKAAPENFKVLNNDGQQINFKAAFSYHPSNDNIAEMHSLKMLEYIWPVSLPRDNNKPLILSTETCRYTKPVNVLPYPDVKWTLDFRFGMKGPEQYTHTNLPTDDRRGDTSSGKPDSRFSKAQEKAVKAGRINTFGMAKRKDGMELEFQLVLKAEYNKGEEIELAAKYAEKIKRFLEILLALKDGLDTLTNIDAVNKGHKSLVKSLSKSLFKAPITGSIDYPALSIGGKWQAAIDERNQVYTDGKLMLRFNPLLKGDVSLDIIAAASYVPAFGQAIKAIEIALNAVGAELNFLLTIFGQVNVEFEYALAAKGGSNLNLNGELGIKLVLSGKVKINLNAVIFEVNGELQAEAYAVTSVKPKASIGSDKKGTYLEAKCDFMGVNIVCTLTAISGKKTYQYKDTYNILDRKDNFVNAKEYIIS